MAHIAEEGTLPVVGMHLVVGTHLVGTLAQGTLLVGMHLLGTLLVDNLEVEEHQLVVVVDCSNSFCFLL